MATEKVFVNGIRAFKPNEKAPTWVKASVVITPNELVKFLKENEKYLSEYKGEKQIKLQLLENDKGLYFVVDTYKKDTMQQNNKFDNDIF